MTDIETRSPVDVEGGEGGEGKKTNMKMVISIVAIVVIFLGLGIGGLVYFNVFGDGETTGLAAVSFSDKDGLMKFLSDPKNRQKIKGLTSSKGVVNFTGSDEEFKTVVELSDKIDDKVDNVDKLKEDLAKKEKTVYDKVFSEDQVKKPTPSDKGKEPDQCTAALTTLENTIADALKAESGATASKIQEEFDAAKKACPADNPKVGTNKTVFALLKDKLITAIKAASSGDQEKIYNRLKDLCDAKFKKPTAAEFLAEVGKPVTEDIQETEKTFDSSKLAADYVACVADPKKTVEECKKTFQAITEARGGKFKDTAATPLTEGQMKADDDIIKALLSLKFDELASSLVNSLVACLNKDPADDTGATAIATRIKELAGKFDASKKNAPLSAGETLGDLLNITDLPSAKKYLVGKPLAILLLGSAKAGASIGEDDYNKKLAQYVNLFKNIRDQDATLKPMDPATQGSAIAAHLKITVTPKTGGGEFQNPAEAEALYKKIKEAIEKDGAKAADLATDEKKFVDNIEALHTKQAINPTNFGGIATITKAGFESHFKSLKDAAYDKALKDAVAALKPLFLVSPLPADFDTNAWTTQTNAVEKFKFDPVAKVSEKLAELVVEEAKKLVIADLGKTDLDGATNNFVINLRSRTAGDLKTKYDAVFTTPTGTSTINDFKTLFKDAADKAKVQAAADAIGLAAGNVALDKFKANIDEPASVGPLVDEGLKDAAHRSGTLEFVVELGKYAKTKVPPVPALNTAIEAAFDKILAVHRDEAAKDATTAKDFTDWASGKLDANYIAYLQSAATKAGAGAPPFLYTNLDNYLKTLRAKTEYKAGTTAADDLEMIVKLDHVRRNYDQLRIDIEAQDPASVTHAVALGPGKAALLLIHDPENAAHAAYFAAARLADTKELKAAKSLIAMLLPLADKTKPGYIAILDAQRKFIVNPIITALNSDTSLDTLTAFVTAATDTGIGGAEKAVTDKLKAFTKDAASLGRLDKLIPALEKELELHKMKDAAAATGPAYTHKFMVKHLGRVIGVATVIKEYFDADAAINVPAVLTGATIADLDTKTPQEIVGLMADKSSADHLNKVIKYLDARKAFSALTTADADVKGLLTSTAAAIPSRSADNVYVDEFNNYIALGVIDGLFNAKKLVLALPPTAAPGTVETLTNETTVKTAAGKLNGGAQKIVDDFIDFVKAKLTDKTFDSTKENTLASSAQNSNEWKAIDTKSKGYVVDQKNSVAAKFKGFGLTDADLA